jgi:DNA topoisomerase-1
MIPPEETKLKGVNLGLYELIWKRTIASQLPNAQLKQVNARIAAGDALSSRLLVSPLSFLVS